MTTLHVDLGRGWRGGQQQAWLLLKGLRARGHAAELVAPEDSRLAARARLEGIRLHTIGSYARRLLTALRLRELLRESHYDVVHLHDAHSLTAAWLGGAQGRAPVLASRRVAYPLSGNFFGLARYRGARRILAVSRFVAQSVLASGLPSDCVAVVYDGIEVPLVLGGETRRQARARWSVEEGELLLGCVGYLLPEKGQESLIRALPAVLASFPRCRLLLAGDGPCRSRLERLARELGVEPRVRFAGFVEDVESVYAALDLYVFPSLAEPLGSSLLSAMAYGLPVVAVGRGAVPEIVEHERNGLLVPEPDAAALATAVVRVLKEPRLASELGAAARRTVEQRFTAEQMVDSTLRLYQEVCGEAGRR